MKFDMSVYEKVDLDPQTPYSNIATIDLEFEKLVASAPDKDKPVYNWVYYKPSYSSGLVRKLIKKFDIGGDKTILDPFCGIGTTALVCKDSGIASWNSDISPYCVFISTIKTNDYDIAALQDVKDKLQAIDYQKPRDLPPTYYLNKCYTVEELSAIIFYWNLFGEIEDRACADFFKFAVLSIMDQYTFARKDGGFLRFKPPGKKSPIHDFKRDLFRKIGGMISDLSRENDLRSFLDKKPNVIQKKEIKIIQSDSRKLDFPDAACDCIITSPPYLNRYDYTRMYALELEMLLLDDEKVKRLRKGTLKSHTESEGYPLIDFDQLGMLKKVMTEIPNKRLTNAQIPRMIHGYFSDLHWCLKEYRRVLRRGSKVAMVVGNCRFSGINVETDKMICELGEGLGFTPEEIIITKLRGSSAQQVSGYGEIQLRESIVILSK